MGLHMCVGLCVFVCMYVCVFVCMCVCCQVRLICWSPRDKNICGYGVYLSDQGGISIKI